VVDIATLDKNTLSAADINRRALPLLDQARDVPFFLFLNYMDAHTPYVPGPPFDSRFPGSDPHIEPASLNQLMLQVDCGKRQLTASEKRHLMAEYDGGIAAEDLAIETVLKRLRDLGLYDNTLIIITADHGDTFGEHDLMDHFLGFVYQDLVHIPLLIKYPGQHNPAESDDLVSQVDLMPTVLDLLKAAAPAQVQGRSLLRPAPNSGGVVYARGTRSSAVGGANPRFLGLRRAVFSGSLKLIAWTKGPSELYDLAADPTEQHNLYSPDDPRAVELSHRLQNLVADMPHHDFQSLKLDKSTVERLKSLGYVQ
jgi:arylsulfatase A-like enzyme